MGKLLHLRQALKIQDDGMQRFRNGVDEDNNEEVEPNYQGISKDNV